jgi:beta-glucosidase
MTFDEKVGQMTLYSTNWSPTGPTLNPDYEKAIMAGKCGSILNAVGVEYISKLQGMAVEKTRLGIPLLFGLDVIHGYRIIFPIPYAEACSWDTALIRETAMYSAKEAAASGLNWTFNPMVDIARDPRWGRVAEGAGEDPFLASAIARARVKGHQGKTLSDPYTIAACVKHFAAYGAPFGGRDYNTVDMSERMLREVYLPPYKAAVEAGAETVMSAFNELDGIPCTGNRVLIHKILRNEWGFRGFVVSDWASIKEMVSHGYAVDEKHAGELALNAGIDMDMQSEAYSKYLLRSLEEGRVTGDQIDESVRRILRLKFKLGLFDNPYLYLDRQREQETSSSREILDHALLAAKKSIVLLKNDPVDGQKVLPVNRQVKRIALIGPLGDNQDDMLGSWSARGEAGKVVTILSGLRKRFGESSVEYAKGADIKGNNTSGFRAAIELATQSDIVICALGESRDQSGEASCRTDIGLPGNQQALIEELAKTGKPIVAIVMAGRPLTLEWLARNVAAILYSGHLGTRAGDAIAEVISGDCNPSGKLVMSFPRNVGQIPVFYNHKNTGRPFDANDFFTSKYLDVDNEPLYPFGFGLSYTTFEYSNLTLNRPTIGRADTLVVSFTVKNTGTYDGEETAQLYIRDMVGSVTRPVKELKGFRKILLKAGEQRVLSFRLTENDLKFYDVNMNFVAEPGKFEVLVGGNSRDLIEANFELVGK